MKRIWLILAAFLGLAATSLPAMADIQYTLNQGGSVGPTPFNYGTVNLHQVGTGGSAYITVTVTLSAGEVFLTTGSHSGFTWNLLGSTTPDSVTITSANAGGFTVRPFNGSYGNSPFGDFEYAIENKDTGGNGGIAGPLVFDIKRTGGLLLTDTLFSANADGNFFGSDIGTGCTFSSGKWGCAKTGVVAANTRIPEPQTWLLFFAGLAGLTALVMLQRRRKLARA
ncbi:MAG TPA: PEP-CTERM sorting domain-containing protein [Rhizomicrobium sp.]|nr:PEP-CTERM sorting domain-containing protein [Rhizomicrobium sp.]